MIRMACATAVTLALATNAAAVPIVLDFEGIGDVASVNDFYNGGTDSAGNRGRNYGIRFSSSSLGSIDQDAGGTGNFANEPSGETVIAFLSGSAATMNVAAGFTTGFSFFYSSSENGFINVYDGLDGGGNLLASIELHDNIDDCGGDPSGLYCRFEAVGVTFDGTARSVDFRGATNNIAFDNISLINLLTGSPSDPDTPVDPDLPGEPGEVPEPATLALSLLGLAGLAAARSRRRRS